MPLRASGCEVRRLDSTGNVPTTPELKQRLVSTRFTLPAHLVQILRLPQLFERHAPGRCEQARMQAGRAWRGRQQLQASPVPQANSLWASTPA